MPVPTTGPVVRPEGVRTVTPPSLLGSRCPVCQKKILQGRQTVCSGRCRAKRWRESKVTRDPEIRAALEEIARLVQVTLGRLETGASHGVSRESNAARPGPAGRLSAPRGGR